MDIRSHEHRWVFSTEKPIQQIITWGFKYTMSHSFTLVGIFVFSSLELGVDTIPDCPHITRYGRGTGTAPAEYKLWGLLCGCWKRLNTSAVKGTDTCCDTVRTAGCLLQTLREVWPYTVILAQTAMWVPSNSRYSRIPYSNEGVTTPIFSRLLFDYLHCKWAEPSPKCRLLTNPYSIYPGNKTGLLVLLLQNKN